MQPIQGLHHITAVAGDPQRNVDFYHHILGQRLIKTTVNFDDPGTYHLYYGDEIGTPGTALTFFPWLHMRRGRLGSGETGAMAYTITPDSIGFWRDHLKRQGIAVEEIQRFSAPALIFADPDGMQLELIPEEAPAEIRFWQDGPIPEQHALRGFHGVTLWLNEIEPTAQLLQKQFGYRLANQQENRFRFQADSQAIGMTIDLLHKPGLPRGDFGSGSIHHIAFRTQDDPEQLAYWQSLLLAGMHVTPVQDRQYFHSIYFREPGGVLFEIATDGPGFLIDETVETMGSALRLPPWHESRRAEIESILPPIERKPVVKAEPSYA